MKYETRILQGLKLAAVLAVALSMGACANKNPLGADGAMASAATPGSQQDFVVNVGEPRLLREAIRRFVAAGDRDPGKAGAVAAELQPLLLHIEGHADERGTREYNIALGARRAQSVRTFLASRHRPGPDADDFLRQRAPGRGVQRHLVLVAEPPGGHGIERRFLRTCVLISKNAPLAPVCFCAPVWSIFRPAHVPAKWIRFAKTAGAPVHEHVHERVCQRSGEWTPATFLAY